jgi:hypothetical protein
LNNKLGLPIDSESPATKRNRTLIKPVMWFRNGFWISQGRGTITHNSIVSKNPQAYLMIACVFVECVTFLA